MNMNAPCMTLSAQKTGFSATLTSEEPLRWKMIRSLLPCGSYLTGMMIWAWRLPCQKNNSFPAACMHPSAHGPNTSTLHSPTQISYTKGSINETFAVIFRQSYPESRSLLFLSGRSCGFLPVMRSAAAVLLTLGRMTHALTVGTWQPKAPLALREYLLGRWGLSKTMTYMRGGVTGSFAGDASFSLLDHEGGCFLAYREDGNAILGAEQATFSAHQKLLWEFGAEEVRVHFDESQDRTTPQAIVSGARFFHTVELSGERPAPFTHPCGPDVYRGELVFVSPEEFALVWDVSGPRKLGHIRATFTRRGTSS